MNSEYINIRVDGNMLTVRRKAFLSKAIKRFHEFGYPSLTLKELDNQVELVRHGKTLKDGLTVIGMFLKNEVIPIPLKPVARSFKKRKKPAP